MEEKRNAIINVAILAGILLIFMAADFFNPDRRYSERENRLLAAKPEWSREKVLSGMYMEQYEEYLTDQFVSRDKWVEIKTRTDMLLQKKDVNGVYLGKGGYLLEQHLPEDYDEVRELQQTARLKQLVEDWDARVMLVPTADNVLTDKLPAYADYLDETRLLNRVRETIGERNYIDVYSVLQGHRDEEIYYRTDHHWTSLGAYYGYQAWTRETLSFTFPYRPEDMTVVSDNFQGTLHSKVPMVNTMDTIRMFPVTEQRAVSVTYDWQTTGDSFYEESYLDTKNQYGYFLDDNHAFIEIETDYKNGRTLFVIKDSYANSMIPLLQPHYSKIYVLDPRYYNGSISRLMEECETKAENTLSDSAQAGRPRTGRADRGMDVLVLYNCVHFLEDFRY